MAPCELTRALFSLRLQGWFDNLNGVLIGRSAAPDVSDPTKHNYLDALKAAFENIAVPVLYDVFVRRPVKVRNVEEKLEKSETL